MERLKHIVQINIILGIWLIMAPFLMGYAMLTVELANDVALGVLLIGCSWWILAASTGQVGASTIQLLWGFGLSQRLSFSVTSGYLERLPTTSVWEFFPSWSVRRERGCSSQD
jgi:hypothetical protein